MKSEVDPRDVKSSASTFASQAIKALEARHIPPTPQNFTVWYCYLTDENPELTRAMTRLMLDRADIGDHDLRTLFDEFFGTNKQASAVDEITEKLVQEIQGVLDNLTGANTASSSYGESLEELSVALNRDLNTSDLRSAISTVAQATHAMAKENMVLSSQLMVSTSEVSQLKTDLEDMRVQAMTDSLTGIANRKCFDLEIENALEFANAENAPVSLLMIDIDHFKSFNDTYGHQVGDQVIKLLADVLKDSVKGQDTPARYGGEEFSIILPETEIQGAVGLAESLRSRIVRRALINKSTGDTFGKITISIGAAQHLANETSEEFIARADKALYGAKNAGRDQVVAA